MKNPQEIQAFLKLNRLRAEGRRYAVSLLEEGKSALEILQEIETANNAAHAFIPENQMDFYPEKEIENCNRQNIRCLVFTDPDYPFLLKTIPDPPLLLYMKGYITESDQKAIAIVGTRHPSFYGRMQAQRFAGALASKGLTIVSGLARGIDQIAHESAIQVPYGRTLAVMGCGLDVVYPKENKDLYKKITEQGAVLSEYPLGTPPLPENFPRRNRILSGLAYGVLVIEAHARSGSLITAHQALEQGREIFALPGPVDQLTSRGTHQLIKEGACLAESPEEVLETLAVHLKTERLKPVLSSEETLEKNHTLSLSPPEKEEDLSEKDAQAATLERILKGGSMTYGEILEQEAISPTELSSLLIRLELTKRIVKMADGKYTSK